MVEAKGVDIICYQCQGGGVQVNGLKLIIGLLGALFFLGGGHRRFLPKFSCFCYKKVISLSHIIIIYTKPIFFSTEILQRKGFDLD